MKTGRKGVPSRNTKDAGRVLSLESLHILLVEDNVFTAMTARRTLESLGVSSVRIANNGVEALEMQADPDNPPDVILVDLRMPGMGGLELLGRLADRQFAGHVIVTSGVDQETMEHVARTVERSSIRVLGFLPKPLTADALRQLLEPIAS